MSNIQNAAKAAFKSNPELYPIVNGIVREEDEDTVEINLNLLAIDLFRNREDKWCTGLKMYVYEVKEAFEQYIEELAEEAVDFLILLYTSETNQYEELQDTFGDYVIDWIKNSGEEEYELKDIAHNFVVYDDGKYLITNESKVV
jgi:hypothetical protein